MPSRAEAPTGSGMSWCGRSLGPAEPKAANHATDRRPLDQQTEEHDTGRQVENELSLREGDRNAQGEHQRQGAAQPSPPEHDGLIPPVDWLDPRASVEQTDETADDDKAGRSDAA